MSAISVEGEISRIKTNIRNAYNVIESRGGVVTERNSGNLSAAIQTIPLDSSSGNGSDPLGFKLGENWIVSESINFGSTNVCWIARGPDRFVGVGNNGLLVYSDDGINWTTGEMPKDSNKVIAWDYVQFVNDKYIASTHTKYGATKIFAYSFDGIHWNAGTSNITRATYMRSLVYGNGMYVGVCVYDGAPLVSEDGVYWEKDRQNEVLDGAAWGVTYVNGKFFFVDGARKIHVTSDLENITTVTLGSSISGLLNVGSYGDTIVCTGARYLVMSQDGGETWVTMDMVATTGTQIDETQTPICVDGLWIFIGTSISSTGDAGLIIYTKDFVHWGRAYYPNNYRNDFCGMAYGANKLLLATYGSATPLVSFGPMPTDI